MMDMETKLRMLACPVAAPDMVLDTDAYNEIDDQFAIAYALKAAGRVNARAFYAAPFTNSRSDGSADGMEKSYHEIEKLLQLACEERPVFRGSDQYLADETRPVDSPAARDLAERAMRYRPEAPLYVVSIGAITNIASALLLNPSISDKIVVVWLGGNAVHWHDNHEFNCSQDVAAARVVFSSGAPLVLLPCMGVVSAFTTTGPELNHWLSGKNALCDYLVSQTVSEANTYAAGRVWSRVIWDVTAVAWLLNQQDVFLRHRLIPTPIPEYDHHYAFNPERPLCRYVCHVHRDALLQDLFTTLSS